MCNDSESKQMQFLSRKKNLLKKLINFMDDSNKQSNLKYHYSSFYAENEKKTKIEPKL